MDGVVDWLAAGALEHYDRFLGTAIRFRFDVVVQLRSVGAQRMVADERGLGEGGKRGRHQGQR